MLSSIDFPRQLPALARIAPATTASRARDTLRWVRLGYLGLVALAAAYQLVLFWRVADNPLATVIALASSLVGIAYALQSARFRRHPVSALILLMYTTTSTSGALLVKSLENAALVDRLLVPVPLFAMLLATQLILIVADRIYLKFTPLQTARRFLSRRLLQPIGVLRWPNDTQLWLMGILGCVSIALTGTDYESGSSFGMASAGMKLIRAFGFLKFAPFLIPFRNALCGVPARTGMPLVALALYFAMLVGISFGTNSRSTFADAVPTIGICVLIGIGLGQIDFRRIPRSRLILLALGAAVGAMLLSRVSLAMVVVRDYRSDVDVWTLIRMTVEAFFNTEWLQTAKARMDDSVGIGNYSETYVDGRFFARFLLTKFHDNILYYFSLMGPDHIASYQGFMWERVYATLPEPLLRYFQIAIDKRDLQISNGDYIVYLIDGWGMGGFKTGSMISEVYSVFGWTFPLVIIASTLLLFVFYDAFTATTPAQRLAVSPLILLLIWNLVGTTAAFGLGAETVIAIPGGIIRGIPQSVIFYVIALWIVRFGSRLIGKG